MECLLADSSEFIKSSGTLGMPLCAMSRFNNPRLLQAEASDQRANCLEHLNRIPSWKPAHIILLLRRPRANTTVFRFNLHQLLYVDLAVLAYLLLLQLAILKLVREIIGWFPANDIPNLIKAGPLVVAAFVVLVFPNVPSFRWAGFKA